MPSTLPFNNWLLIFLIIFQIVIRSNAFCPIKCHCDDSLLLADCTGGLLDLVPITLNPQIRELHLAANQIKSIKETLSFYNNLLLLDLNDNQLQSLGERNFYQLKTLKILKIGNNRLSLLNNQTFAGLINLQQLYLNHNELRSIHNDVFNLQRLRLLDLSHNALANLQNDVFSNLIQLELINLSHNRFDKLSTLIFDRLTSLKVLHLDHNSLQQLPDFLFRSLKQLHTLTLNHCELRNLNKNIFFGLENLKHLKLNHNQFNQLSNDVFFYLENLENLELQGTNFLQLPNLFTPLKNLKYLSLGHDRFLKQLNNELFIHNTKLQSIAIEHCPSLEQLPNGLFNTQKQLILVNLGQNALTTLQSNIFVNHANIQRLILTANPLHCECGLSWLYSSPILQSDKLIISNLIKKFSLSLEDGEELERILEKWSGRNELNYSNKQQFLNQNSSNKNLNKHHSHHHKKLINNFKQPTYLNTGHLNSIEFNSAEYIDHNNNNNQLKEQTDQYEQINLPDDHQNIQNNNNNLITATCFEPLPLVGRPLIELTSSELNCNSNSDHQTIVINGEKINFENRNSNLGINGFNDQQFNNKEQFNDDILNTNNGGLSLFTVCFFSVLIVCFILFIILFSYIYFRRHKKDQQPISLPISSWILKQGSSNNATLSFQPFASSFDMNQDHHLNSLNLNQPKCNTLVNPLSKLSNSRPLPKKPSPLINNQNNLLINNSSINNQTLNYNSNTLNPTSTIKLTPQITRISNLTTNNSNSELTNKLYEQVDYTSFENNNAGNEQIYEDPLVDDLNTANISDLNLNNYSYQQLNSTTSTASSYLSNNNAPTYEEYLAAALMRSTPNNSSYGTLNNQQQNRFFINNNFNNQNLNNNNNNNFNRNNNRRTLNNTMVHL